MVTEVLASMQPRSGGVYCDCTVGTGGHSLAILDASAPEGRLVGVDRDRQALETASRRLSSHESRRWSLHHGRFSDLHGHLSSMGVSGCDGVLADLGLSSLQLDDPERGFSFRLGGPLDMRMDTSSPGTALDVIRGTSTSELSRIIHEYGEERHASRVARVLHEQVRQGRIRDTEELARAVRTAVGRARAGGVDSATRTFQALRVAVNRELDELEALLGSLLSILAPGGVFVCLAYHSLEDRLVKHALRKLARAGEGEVLTPKPLVPGRDEVRENRRARSAKMRAFRRASAREV